MTLEILTDGSIQTTFSAETLDDKNLEALSQASHLDALVTGLGQRLRHYVENAWQSGNRLRFAWYEWNQARPVFYQIAVEPDDDFSAVTVRVSRAQDARQRALDAASGLEVLDYVADGVVVAQAEQSMGAEPRIVHVNPGFTAFSGFRPDELFGQDPRVLFDLQNTPCGMRPLRALAGRSGTAERVLCCKNGSRCTVELTVKPVTDEAGWLVQWILVVRPRGSSSPHENRQLRLLDDALQATRAGVLITDAGAQGSGPKIVYANREFCRYTGYRVAELLGQSLFHLLAGRPDQPVVAPPYDEIEPAAFNQRTTRCQRKDGAEFWLRWHSLSPVYDGSGRVTNFVALVQDVTAEYTDIEKQIQESRRESIGLLAAGTAHDLNNVLTSICSIALLAKEEVPPEMQALAGCLQQIEDAVMMASQRTRQLFSFARSGAASVEAAVALPKLLRETVKFSLKGSAVRSKFQLDEACPPVLADDAGLCQAISNLVINAAEAMPGGGTCEVKLERVTLAPGVLSCLLPGNYVQITICDTGRGIAPEALPHVFEPYYTTKQGGKGLGLTVARALVQKHGGHLELNSVVGQGTTAVIYLPVYAGGLDEAPSNDQEIIHGCGRVLLMEDEPKLREGLERAVRALGYESAVAEDGTEALELYASALHEGVRFDVVVLDLTVPGGMGAKATLPKLRELDPTAKVVIASGYNEADVLASVSEMGFDALLPKPYTFAELSRVLAYAAALRPLCAGGEPEVSAGR
ncbi:MAG: PAS domain-containing protein [Verrucomicrobia bacterium]|nr:PAS domain-containing protein [Verrucomicrobiota bacterium]